MYFDVVHMHMLARPTFGSGLDLGILKERQYKSFAADPIVQEIVGVTDAV